MQSLQTILVFVLFLALAAAKLLLPQQAEELRGAVRELVWREEPYVQRLESVGARLAEQGLQDGLISVFREEAEEPETPPEAEPAGDGGQAAESGEDESTGEEAGA